MAKLQTIDKQKHFYEIQINCVTFDVEQSFTKIKKAFCECGYQHSQHRLKNQIYRVWLIKNGFKFPVPLTAMGVC